MKSFNQFLQESYLNEEPADAGRPMKKRKPGGPTPEEVKAEIYARDEAKAAKKAQRGPTGAAADSTTQFRPRGTTTNVSGSAFKPATIDAASSTSPSASGAPASGKPPWRPGGHNVNPTFKPQQGPKPAPAATPSGGKPPWRPGGHNVNPTFKPQQGPKPAPAATPSGGKFPSGSSGASSVAKEAEKAAAKTATKTAGKGILKGLGKVAGPASAALDVADELGKGSSPLRALTKGAVVAAGGALGGAAGTAAGPVGTFVGATGGSIAASKAFDVVAGKNARERAADRMANRQKQAGGAIKGIGGKTTFDTKKNTITTGTGPQKRTAQLGKTSVITGPGGKQEVGHLAYKGGKAVYKRAAAAGSDGGIFARIRRAVDPSGSRQSDAANAANKLATARQNDANRQKALGVKFGPGK